ncbi:hypothetical protein AOZ07_01365 [Glutamicibacter halophytocola]|nr:hypothetical protein AOZ07_01365 [Glutamicibacter halophytocola]
MLASWNQHKIRTLDVIVTYELGDVVDRITVSGPDYYGAKEQADSQVPEGAITLNTRVVRDVDPTTFG